MSIRTLVEINHDKLHDIERNPAEFVERMAAAIRSGGTHQQNMNNDGYDGDTHNRLWEVGGAIKYSRHHTGKCPAEQAASEPYVNVGEGE